MPDTRDVLAELVAIPTVSSFSAEFDCPNRPLIDRVADYFDGLGWRCEILPLTQSPGKANLVASLGEGEDGLVLAGHSDTVPYDEDAWTSNPFRLSERDGRLYGLGAADMKGFIAICMALAARIDARSLARPLHVVVTADEESRMDGARLLEASDRPRAACCIIGEPTDLVPIRMHKGVMMEAVVVHGGAGHSSKPETAPSAIEGLNRVMTALIALRDELGSHHRMAEFAVPYPTLNLGRILGGDNPNRICARAEAHFDLRPLPGMELDALRREIDRRALAALEGTGCRYERCSLFEGVEPFSTPADSVLVKAAEAVSGRRAEAVSFGTEAGFFSAMGMQAVVLGPGSIDVAHRPDEYIEVAALARGEALVEKLVGRLAGR